MKKTEIEHGENDTISIKAGGNRALNIAIYTTGSDFVSSWPDMLSDDDNSNQKIIDTMTESIKMVFEKNLVFEMPPVTLKAQDVYKVELSNGSWKVLATVVNEVIY